MGRRKHYPRWKRAKLWNVNPRCFWCGCLTLLEYEHGALPRDAATLDHLRPRHHPTRRVMPKNNEVRIVLSCNACNNARDRRETAALPREVLWMQSDSLPLSLRPDEYVLEAYRRCHDRRNKPIIEAELNRRGIAA